MYRTGSSNRKVRPTGPKPAPATMQENLDGLRLELNRLMDNQHMAAQEDNWERFDALGERITRQIGIIAKHRARMEAAGEVAA